MRTTPRFGTQYLAICLFAGTFSTADVLAADSPSPEQALRFRPVQSDVLYDVPDPADYARCRIEAENVGDATGWVVYGPRGEVLRRFVDTNRDKVVDQWSYYRDGAEVYRDLDGNFNKKADQYRWLNQGGTRWGIDTDEDGRIDLWKRISAEEVSREAVRALAMQDYTIFAPLVVTNSDLDQLALPAAMRKDLAERLSDLPSRFRALTASLKEIDKRSQWVRFDGAMPALFPRDAAGTRDDLIVHQNVVAVVDTAGQSQLLNIGEMLQVGAVWRLMDLPQLLQPGATQLADRGVFSPVSSVGGSAAGVPAVDPVTQKLLAQLQDLDQRRPSAQGATYHVKRADVIEQLVAAAKSSEEREQWIRQLADGLTSAVQTGEFGEGMLRLKRLVASLEDQNVSAGLAAYVTFRQLSAEYSLAIQDPKANFQQIQATWLKQLEAFVAKYPQADDAGDAMLQLAVAHEFSGNEKEARQWYGRLVDEFPRTEWARKGGGAIRRLDLVGKPFELRAASLDRSTVDVAAYRGKIVVVAYWATWCEPCKADLVELKKIYQQYARQGLQIVGVCLDTAGKDAAEFVEQSRIPWPQVFEPGGLNSRPAVDFGIVSLPSMFLVDQDGKVVNRNLHISQLEGEIKKLLR